DYDAQYEPIFGGRGTTTLTVHGTVHINANITDTSYAAYDIAANYTPKDQSPEFNLIPGPHGISLAGRYNRIPFHIAPPPLLPYTTPFRSSTTTHNTTPSSAAAAPPHSPSTPPPTSTPTSPTPPTPPTTSPPTTPPKTNHPNSTSSPAHTA